MTPEENAKSDAAAHARLKVWREDPIRFVREVFQATPDPWQADALISLRDNERTALSACKGPGKTCAEAWFAWNMLSCYVESQGMALSITGDNLRDNLWKELAYWQARSPYLRHAFVMNAEAIRSREHPKTWWLSARAFSQTADKTQQAASLAGFHAKVQFVILDEFGEYPPGVLPAAEAIFSVEGVHARLLVAGNPTTRNGPLYKVCTEDAHRWTIIKITGDPEDPKRSSRISLKWAQQQIDDFGRENVWVKANVLGEFPDSGSDQLINIEHVVDAQKRDVPFHAYKSDPIIWGIDPARSGNGDEIALARRQGSLARRILTWRGLDGPQLANRVAALIAEAERSSQLPNAVNEVPDAIFIDVGGVGASAYDHLRFLGWDKLVKPVDFGWGADNKKFQNKRTEMWYTMADWVKMPTTCLPNDPQLRAELVAPEGKYEVKNKRTVFTLESKDSMKSRGVPSPNRADALAVTFAAPMAPVGRGSRALQPPARSTRAITDYNPYARR